MILGHLSMLLDLKLTKDERFLLTTDRDEKVRISNYPQAFVVRSFCLGHTQYVRSVVVWGDELVVSAGGDGSIKIWSLDGDCKFTIPADSDPPKPILKIDLAVHDVRSFHSLFRAKYLHILLFRAASDSPSRTKIPPLFDCFT